MSEYDIWAEIYDLQFEGYEEDISFYVGEAERATPPVLELACGTGRVTIPIAQAGVEVVGLDSSPEMLAVAQKKVARLSPEVRERIRLLEGDMRDFSLDERFGLIMIPFRSFLLLLRVEDQKQALRNIHRHLRPDGRLALNLFVPDLAIIASHSSPLGEPLKRLKEVKDPETGHRIIIWETRHYDQNRQIIDNFFIYDELDEAGVVVKRTYRPLRLRWVYRCEMEHLLDLCGFRVEELYGGFNRQPFDENSREMVWVATPRREVKWT